MFDRYHRTVEETQDLDLLPVMNLFMVLIPFLLMGAAFFHIGAIPVSLPNHAPSQASEQEAKPEVVVTLNLVVAPDELSVSASSAALDTSVLQGLALTLPKVGEGYDLQALQAHLQRIKTTYPKSDTTVVLPHADLNYAELVAILDSSREYKAGVDAKGDPQFAPLFPKVVFSRFVTAEETAARAASAGPSTPIPTEATP